MARLRFTILGCGASPGVPRITGDWGACDPREPKNRRTRCCALIERFGESFLPTRVVIDTGPDFRMQMLAAQATHLDAVAYTHAHADHLHGVDDLRGYWIQTGALVPIYSDDFNHERISEGFGYCLATPAGSDYPPFLERRRVVPGVPFTVDGPGGPLELLPFSQVHGSTPSIGYRVAGIAYSCDLSDLPDESLSLLDDLDVWIVDGLRHRPHPSHWSIDEAIGWIRRVRPRRGILTHMTNEIDYTELHRALPPTIEPAYDGLVIEIDLPA